MPRTREAEGFAPAAEIPVIFLGVFELSLFFLQFAAAPEHQQFEHPHFLHPQSESEPFALVHPQLAGFPSMSTPDTFPKHARHCVGPFACSMQSLVVVYGQVLCQVHFPQLLLHLDMISTSSAAV